MVFSVPADAYDRFMGRYSKRLAPDFADFGRVSGAVVDVGCGPGALTAELVTRFGAERVAAADPSEPFVAAVRERFPGVDVRLAPAEALPFDDAGFDCALAQLVVHFMSDPIAGVREMARVTRPGGIVAACVWDMSHAPLTPFWRAVKELDPSSQGEGQRPGTREGHLAEIFHEAGVADVESASLPVRVEHERFEEWWEPYTLGVGPAGAHYAMLDEDARAELRRTANGLLGDGPISIDAQAWAVRGVVT
jgi:SAM-dependent methyltransferase